MSGARVVSAVSGVRVDTEPGQVMHGFFEGPRPLFGSYHVPAQPVRDIGYVLCPPIGWEGIQSYESVRRLAVELAAAGFPTLRLAYDGTGESPGSDEEPGRVAAWLESVRRAILALSALPTVTAVGLVGVRLGATLAASVAGSTELATLVLWEPCVSGAQYTREMEIVASAAPRAPAAGSPRGIEAGGYRLTPETVADLGKLDLTKVVPQGNPAVLLVCRDDRPPLLAKKLAQSLEAAGRSVALEQLPGHKEALTYPEKAVVATRILERIRAFAVERSSVAGDAASSPPASPDPPLLALDGQALVGGLRHRPIRFGPAGSLFGVVTEPRSAGAAQKPLLLLTGGVVPRTSVNRMYVELATRLAEKGHTVLRMDVSGICESPPAEGAAPNEPHAASLLDDVRAAVEVLLASTGHDTVGLLGLCSGAYATFQTALADPRVISATLLNPEVFHLRGGSTRFSETEQSNAAKHYRQSLTDPAAWKKLLSGKANLRYIVGFVGARVGTALAARRDRLVAWRRRAPQGVAGDLHRLLSRGVTLAIVVAEGDPGYDPLMAHLGDDRAALERMGLRLKVVPGPDHTFNDFSVRPPLVEWLVDVLSR